MTTTLRTLLGEINKVSMLAIELQGEYDMAEVVGELEYLSELVKDIEQEGRVAE